MAVDETMEISACTIHTFMGERKYRFGCMELFPRVQPPSEGCGIQTAKQSYLAMGGGFDNLGMVSTVDQIAAIAIPR
jgi:hypothetical protein